MERININGVEYVALDDISACWEHVCVICTNGWIFKGNANPEDPQRLMNASVVRKWSNGRGIGALAKAEYKNEYVLDAVGDIRINKAAEISRFKLEW